MNERMNEWMNEWKDAWMSELENEWRKKALEDVMVTLNTLVPFFLSLQMTRWSGSYEWIVLAGKKNMNIYESGH